MQACWKNILHNTAALFKKIQHLGGRGGTLRPKSSTANTTSVLIPEISYGRMLLKAIAAEITTSTEGLSCEGDKSAIIEIAEAAHLTRGRFFFFFLLYISVLVVYLLHF